MEFFGELLRSSEKWINDGSQNDRFDLNGDFCHLGDNDVLTICAHFYNRASKFSQAVIISLKCFFQLM